MNYFLVIKIIIFYLINTILTTYINKHLCFLVEFKGRPGMYDWKVLMSKLTREESGLSIE